MNTEKIALAGELALGLLEKDEQDRVRRDLEGDMEMREAYRFWNERFVSQFEAEDMAEVTPSPQVLSNIEFVLFGEEQTSTWSRLVDALRAPENRGLVVTLAIGKLALLAWILYLFL